MSVRHLTDDAVVNLLLDPTPEKVTRDRLRRLKHFDRCSNCRERYNEFARFVSLLGTPDVWDAAGPVKVERPRAWLRQATAALRRIREEREGLDDLLDTTLRGPSRTWKGKLAATDRLTTYSMVEALLDRADRFIRATPADALELTSLAVDIADQLPVDTYPFDFVITLRARAYREHSFSLYYSGRMPEALTFVDRAEQLFRQTPLPTFELARVAVMRAIIYLQTDRVDEAIQLTHDAANTFLSFGDRSRYINTRMTEAATLFRRRRYQEALAIWQPLETEESIREQPTFGMLLQHLGSVHRQLNDLDRARSYYLRAIDEHRKHNATTDELRVRWSLALTLMAEQKQREALPVLRDVWRRFSDLQMADDAALVALKLAEVLLMLDEPAEVPAICRALLDHFARNRTRSAAVVALSYLREAVAAGKAKPSLVSEIHDFIRDLPNHPTRRYSPSQI